MKKIAVLIAFGAFALLIAAPTTVKAQAASKVLQGSPIQLVEENTGLLSIQFPKENQEKTAVADLIKEKRKQEVAASLPLTLPKTDQEEKVEKQLMKAALDQAQKIAQVKADKERAEKEIKDAAKEKEEAQVIQTDQEEEQETILAGPYSAYNSTYPVGQCTAYVKDYFGSRVGDYWGNGGDWAYSAQADGYAVDSVPSAQSVAVFLPYGGYGIGAYGHVAVCVGVNGDGTITVQDANVAGFAPGTPRVVSATGVLFVHV